MAYIRDRKEEHTGYQSSSPLLPAVDHQCDFVMVYGLNETTAERVKKFRGREGLRVQLKNEPESDLPLCLKIELA